MWPLPCFPTSGWGLTRCVNISCLPAQFSKQEKTRKKNTLNTKKHLLAQPLVHLKQCAFFIMEEHFQALFSLARMSKQAYIHASLREISIALIPFERASSKFCKRSFSLTVVASPDSESECELAGLDDTASSTEKETVPQCNLKYKLW